MVIQILTHHSVHGQFMTTTNNDTQYIAMWDMHGLEYLANVTKIDQENTFSILKDEGTKLVPLREMILRAKFNSQRHYEIYAFISPLSQEEIEFCFENNPQTIVNQIRSVGHQIYSDRLQLENSKIKIV